MLQERQTRLVDTEARECKRESKICPRTSEQMSFEFQIKLRQVEFLLDEIFLTKFTG